MASEQVVVDDADNYADIEPITGDLPSSYDAAVATVDESGAAPITARPPGPYDSVVTFGDADIGPVITGASTPYAVVLDESGVGPVFARPPTPYTSVVFADSEVEVIVGRRSSSPYDRSVVFDESDTGQIVVSSAGSPYHRVVAPSPAAIEPNLGSRPAG